MHMKKEMEEWQDTIYSEHLDDLSVCSQREEILKGLEEEFRKGLQEVRKAKEKKSPASKQERIYSEIHIPRKGQSRWESIRGEHVKNVPITAPGMPCASPENRKDAYKINLKEPILFFNVCSRHLVSVTEKGVIKIFSILSSCQLEKVWEISHHLFGFLIRTKAIPHSVADTLSTVLLELYCKRVKDLEKVFQELLTFCKITTVKKAFFFNGYLCLVSSFGEMQIFDETLREIPIGKNLKPIIRSILKEPVEKKEHVNKMVRHEETVSLKSITVKVLRNKIKLIYSKKSVYEEIAFAKNEQVVYTDNMLFLKERESIHVILLE
ncbi:uncharacterized protein NEMAJ01_2217 [Nematocida major]|uniref:uncharacterized protein n=1 Tax=Nematocida major TaxID=1912982 RepID=UPI0020085E4B|nr:uncharacterized protein NEMAJ01_2217 [Nematocida major]KAH9387321.1 hypothetical protein NEMAJ01_2217 [Nematocida major]